MIIDFHTHVLPPRIKADRTCCVKTDPTFAAIYASEKARIATAEDLIDSMDREGIDISVIAGYSWSTPEICAETNDYILESISRYPKRLAGLATVLPENAEDALREIERCAQGGVRGVGEIRPDLASPDFTSGDFLKALAEVLRRHNLVLLTHASEPIGHKYPGKGTVTPDILCSLIANLPNVPVVCAHWGGGLPFYALMPEVQKALQNVYFDSAASPYLYRPQIYSLVRQLVGADRVLFGSDYPLLSPGRFLHEIDAAGLPQEEKDMILSGNALRLLGIQV